MQTEYPHKIEKQKEKWTVASAMLNRLKKKLAFCKTQVSPND